MPLSKLDTFSGREALMIAALCPCARSVLVPRVEQQLQIAYALDEFLLFGGTAFENAHQVFDTGLPRCGNFPDANFVGHMADDGQALSVSSRAGCKIGIARNLRLPLMKSTPSFLSKSTAAIASVTAIELGKRSLPSGRYPSSMGPEIACVDR